MISFKEFLKENHDEDSDTGFDTIAHKYKYKFIQKLQLQNADQYKHRDGHEILIHHAIGKAVSTTPGHSERKVCSTPEELDKHIIEKHKKWGIKEEYINETKESELHTVLKNKGFSQNHMSGVYERMGNRGPKGRNTHYVHISNDGNSWAHHKKGELTRGLGKGNSQTGFGVGSLESYLAQQKDLRDED